MSARPPRPLLAALAVGLLVGVGPVKATAAAWNDRTGVGAVVTVASAACDAAGLFLTSASAADVAGTVQGAAIGAGAPFGPVATGVRADAVSRSVPLSVAATGVAPAVAGVVLPLRLTAGATWTQSASTTGTGTAAATAGGGAAFGSVDVSGLLGRSPSAAARLPGLSSVVLDIGRIDASARLDGCAAAFGASDPLHRTSAVSSLGLRFVDAAALDGTTATRTNTAAATAAVTAQALTATPQIASAAGGALLTAVQQSLTALNVAGASATATPAPAAATALAVPAVAAPPGSQTADAVRLDTTTGEATVDLTAAASAGTNTDVLSADRLRSTAGSIGSALDQQAAAATAGVTTARDATAVAVRASVDVAVTTLGVTTTVATVSVDQTASASAWAGGAAPVAAVTVTARGGTPVAGLGDAVAVRLPALLAPAVQGAVTAGFVQPTTAALAASSAATTAALGTARSATAAHLAAVPGTVQATADLRPAGAADDWTGTAGTGRLTALRIRVLDGTGARADLFLGNVQVGPATPVRS